MTQDLPLEQMRASHVAQWVSVSPNDETDQSACSVGISGTRGAGIRQPLTQADSPLTQRVDANVVAPPRREKLMVAATPQREDTGGSLLPAYGLEPCGPPNVL